MARSRGPRWVAIGLSSVLSGGAVVGYLTLPQSVRDHFTFLQVGTLVLFLVVMDVIMLALGLGYVRADDDGLKFRNGLRTHRLPWEAVTGIRFGPGNPWPYAQLDSEFAVNDHDEMMLMGIQGSDGDFAAAQVARLREIVAEKHAEHRA